MPFVVSPRAGRSRFPGLNLNAVGSGGGDELTGERRRQLKLSFQPDCIKPAAVVAAVAVVKPQPLPEKTRYA